MSELTRSLDFGPGLEVSVRSLASPRSSAKRENQDNFLLVDATGRAVFLHGQREASTQIAGWPAGHVRLAVLDGVGSVAGGRVLTEQIIEELCVLPAQGEQALLNAEIEALHAHLQSQYPEDPECPKRPGATLVLLEVAPPAPGAGYTPMLFHVGDSRLMALRPDAVEVLTVDHAPPTEHAMQHMLNEAEWRQQVHCEDRTVIKQALVMGNTFAIPGKMSPALFELTAERLPEFLRAYPDRRTVALDPEIIYLMATDGMWSYVHPWAFIQRWPDILHKADSTQLSHRLDDLFVEHILASAEVESVDNSTAIALRVKSRV